MFLHQVVPPSTASLDTFTAVKSDLVLWGALMIGVLLVMLALQRVRTVAGDGTYRSNANTVYRNRFSERWIEPNHPSRRR